MTRPTPADRDDTAQTLHGVTIEDPYRYLEDPEGERTRAFVLAQNDVSTPFLAALPGREGFLTEVTRLLTAPRLGVPWERGGRYFMISNPGHLDQDRLMVADTVDELLAEGGRIVLDPNDWAADGTAALTGLGQTRDGGRLAYARSDAGSDWLTIRAVELPEDSDPVDLGVEIRWSKWVSPTWLPDAGSLLYWRYPEPQDDEDTAALPAGELVRYRISDGAQDVVWAAPDREWMVAPWVSDDGRYLVLSASPGTDSRTSITVRRLHERNGATVIDDQDIVVVPELDAAHEVVGMAGDTLYLRTERDAPSGALVAVDLTAPDAWTYLLRGDDERVLVGAELTGGALCVQWSVDAAHRLEIVELNGTFRAALDVDGPVAITGLHGDAESDELFVGTSSFTHRLNLYRWHAGSLAALPTPGVEMAPMIVTRLRTPSSDGVAVPMSVVRRADLAPGPAPTLLYGYGGFDIPVLPSFSALFSAWVDAGGVLAVANLRGGGEFGPAWHEAGMKHHKQQVFDDLFACAQRLVDDGVTTTGRLAVHGRSNGGLLVGAALTQRPDLWAACLPTVGVLDMLRFHQFTIGWAWTSDYGSPEDPDEFATLLAYSPLHRLVPGTAYPPTLICTGDHDDRVVPAHSLKFGAQLQFCQADRDAPILLRIDTRAGHGVGKPIRALAAEYADQLAFAAHFTGLD